jgi:hypothetical protein
MTYTNAKRMLKAVCKKGYVQYHSGIVSMDGNYAINVDGDGQDGRYFGCPKIIWTVTAVNELIDGNYKLPKNEQ